MLQNVTPLRGKKKLMYETLKRQLGCVTAATKIVGITRMTHYRWMKADENYKTQVEDIEDYIIDIVDNALLKSIMEGSVQAQVFFMKTRGQKKGYVEIQRNINLNIEPDSAASMSEVYDIVKQTQKKTISKK